jgi:hypothetical protein
MNMLKTMIQFVERIEQVSAQECSSSGYSNVVGHGISSQSGKEIF